MYSIKKVSELVGIPAVTIRAWEKRYHIIDPKRSEGGHRLYSDQDIQTLIWLKKQMEENGFKISEAARLLHEDKQPVSFEDESSSSSLKHEEKLTEELYHAFLALNSTKANEILDLAFSLFNYRFVFHRLLAPLLSKIGEDWETGRVTIAQEHFSSEIITQRFHQLFRVLPINPQQPKALAFCPEGEHHQIGLMLFCLFLREKGMDVIYLGANTPYSDLITLIQHKNVANVAVSVSHKRHLDALLDWVRNCHDARPNTRFILGGKAFHNSDVPSYPYVSIIQGNSLEEWEEIVSV